MMDRPESDGVKQKAGNELTPERKARPGGGAPKRPRWHWPTAVLVAVAVHGAAFSILGINSVRVDSPRRIARGVDWVGERPGRAQNAISDALDLLDPAPLFLPTRRNVATREAGVGEAQGSGDIFGLEVRQLSVVEGSSPAGLVRSPEDRETALGTIQRFARPYFSAFARVDGAIGPTAERLAWLEVRSADTGELLFTQEVPRSAANESAPWPSWEPFEILLGVEATGSLGPPLIAAPGWRAQARADMIDDFFRTYLRSGLRPDLLLPAGYYRVIVGP